MQQLASVVEAVPHFTQHHSEGLCDGHRVPEVSIVLALALLHQLVDVSGLLGMHLLCQGLPQTTLSSVMCWLRMCIHYETTAQTTAALQAVMHVKAVMYKAHTM